MLFRSFEFNKSYNAQTTQSCISCSSAGKLGAPGPDKVCADDPPPPPPPPPPLFSPGFGPKGGSSAVNFPDTRAGSGSRGLSCGIGWLSRGIGWLRRRGSPPYPTIGTFRKKVQRISLGGCLSTGFLELIPPLVLKPPRTRGGINWVPHPKSKKFRLRRAKIIITRILIYLTARRRRKILRFCACKNTFFFAKTVLMC